MFAFSVTAQRKKEEDREGQKERESRIVERRESLTQPVQRGFHAPLTCLAGLYKQHRHGVGGPSCTANNRTTFGGRIRAESEVEPGSSNACVNGRPGGAGQGHVDHCDWGSNLRRVLICTVKITVKKKKMKNLYWIASRQKNKTSKINGCIKTWAQWQMWVSPKRCREQRKSERLLWEMQLDTVFESCTKVCLPIQKGTAVCCYGNKLQKHYHHTYYLVYNAHVGQI